MLMTIHQRVTFILIPILSFSDVRQIRSSPRLRDSNQ